MNDPGPSAVHVLHGQWFDSWYVEVSLSNTVEPNDCFRKVGDSSVVKCYFNEIKGDAEVEDSKRSEEMMSTV